MFILLHLVLPSKRVGFLAISNHCPENLKQKKINIIAKINKNFLQFTSLYLKLE